MPIRTIEMTPRGPGLYDFTAQARRALREMGAADGLLTVFVRHTSCSLLVQENADPAVQDDLAAFFRQLVPPSDDPSQGWMTHTQEGPDDMPAHVKAALTQVSIGVPVAGGEMLLGTWQGLYLFEHRTRPRMREIVLQFLPG